MPRGKKERDATPASSSSQLDDEDYWGKAFAHEAKKAERKLEKAAMKRAGDAVDEIMERYEHAVTVTHPTELSAIHAAAAAKLEALDAAQAKLAKQLVAANAVIRAATDKFEEAFWAVTEACDKIESGAVTTIKHERAEEKRAVDAMGWPADEE
ncbi:hypothetical protein Q5752_006173 [Cryptotrichosporon argae]